MNKESDNLIDPKNIDIETLKDCIQSIQAIHGYHKSISYRTIQRDIKDLYGYEVELDRIEEYYDPATKDLSVDTYLQYRHQGLID